MKSYILLFFIIFFSGCSLKNSDFISKQNNKNKALYNLVVNSSSSINKDEALEFSDSIIKYSQILANSYGVVSIAIFHNLLVNFNIKDKGLCFHYANDMLKFLKERNYKTIRFFKVVSNKDKYFEHTAVILTADGISFEDSIVLDAWRDGGDLYFSKIKDDEKYKWELR
jgi:hypothetical protein